MNDRRTKTITGSRTRRIFVVALLLVAAGAGTLHFRQRKIDAWRAAVFRLGVDTRLRPLVAAAGDDFVGQLKSKLAGQGLSVTIATSGQLESFKAAPAPCPLPLRILLLIPVDDEDTDAVRRRFPSAEIILFYASE
ncbi:MAG TPA: hypothetical protein VM452_18995 [Caulifigura sp.]|nr:hypothetical protein [Caulifigura sp.]